MQFSKDVTANMTLIDKQLKPDVNFDVIRRDIIIAERVAALYFIDGFIKDEMFEKVMEYLFKLTPEQLSPINNMEQYMRRYMPYVEVAYESDSSNAITQILSGPAVLLIDGIADALVIDIREYPVRAINEPEKDRSLRGSRDGFVETLIFNTALIRRRIRDPRLRMEYMQIGKISKVDVAITYMDGIADPRVVEKLKKQLAAIDLHGISMTSQAIAEKLVPSAFFNPFPKIKYTERPDYASACIIEGKVLLVMDNSPMVMIFPISFADFAKEVDDYYFPPLTGTYVRIVRIFISVFTVILTPLTLFFINNSQLTPKWLEFILPLGTAALPVFVQFLALEIIVDGLKIASLNTPDSQANSLSIIGGLLLSEFAVSAGWFMPETILYMATVAIASYSQPSFEMGYALKFVRMFTLIATQYFNLWGLIGGLVLAIIIMLCSKTLSGRNYLYPIIPFNPKDCLKLIVRTKIKQ